MKPLIKPQQEYTEKQNQYEALCESHCKCHQACLVKYYSDEEDDEILF